MLNESYLGYIVCATTTASNSSTLRDSESRHTGVPFVLDQPIVNQLATYGISRILDRLLELLTISIRTSLIAVAV